MGYDVDYHKLDKLKAAIFSSGGEWIEGINESLTSAANITDNKNISGKAADSIKLYFDAVYKLLQVSLLQILQLEQVNFTAYLSDYFDGVDGYGEARIKQHELQEIKDKIEQSRLQAIEADRIAEEALIKVSDIFSYSFTDVASVDEAHNDLEKFLSELDTDISELESRHMGADFTEIQQCMANVKSFISEQMSHGRNYMTSVTPEMLASSAAFASLISGSKLLSDSIDSKREAFKADLETVTNHDKAVQEIIEERQKVANRWKLVAGIALAVITTVATAGAAGWVTFAVVGAVTGSVGAGFNETMDQWAVSGGREYDLSKIGKEAFIGGITGAAKGTVGYGAKALFKGADFIQDGLKSSSGFARAGTRFVVGATKSTASGIATRAAESITRDLTYEGRVNLGDVAEETFDTAETSKDFIMGGIKETSNLTGHGDKNVTQANGDFVDRVVEGGIKSGVENVAEGVVDRTVGGVLDEVYGDGLQKEDLAKIGEDVLDREKIAGDMAKGTVSGAVDGYKSYREDKIKGFDLEGKEYTTEYRNEDGSLKANVRFSLNDVKHDGKDSMMFETDGSGRIIRQHNNATGHNVSIEYDGSTKTVTETNVNDTDFYNQRKNIWHPNAKTESYKNVTTVHYEGGGAAPSTEYTSTVIDTETKTGTTSGYSYADGERPAYRYDEAKIDINRTDAQYDKISATHIVGENGHSAVSESSTHFTGSGFSGESNAIADFNNGGGSMEHSSSDEMKYGESYEVSENTRFSSADRSMERSSSENRKYGESYDFSENTRYSYADGGERLDESTAHAGEDGAHVYSGSSYSTNPGGSGTVYSSSADYDLDGESGSSLFTAGANVHSSDGSFEHGEGVSVHSDINGTSAHYTGFEHSAGETEEFSFSRASSAHISAESPSDSFSRESGFAFRPPVSGGDEAGSFRGSAAPGDAGSSGRIVFSGNLKGDKSFLGGESGRSGRRMKTDSGRFSPAGMEDSKDE